MSKSIKNVLIFLTDDHAQWALKSYGNHHIMTPNLDFLAETGIQFDNAFTPTPVCSPARACFHTGRISSQHGIHDFLSSDTNEIDEKKWLQNEKTIGEIFHKEGYYTGYMGKWHMGQETKKHAGYDECFTLGSKYPMEHGEEHTYYRNGVPDTIKGYKTQVVTDEAVKFLNSALEDKPFFLFVGHYATHSPWTRHPERLVSHYRNIGLDEPFLYETYPFGEQALESTNSTRDFPKEALAQYYGAVTQIDESIGRILDTLQALEKLDSTLIVYTSDHGLNCGQHGIWGKGNGTLPLNMVEESIRVPMLIRDPELNNHGIKREEFIDHTDLFQTILESVGIDLKNHSFPGISYPGRSFYPWLSQEKGNLNMADWKTHQFCEYGNVRMVRSGRYKLLLRNGKHEDQLFDLEIDPHEIRNLINDESYNKIINKLSKEIFNFYEKYQDSDKSGLNIRTFPRYNMTEAWRDVL